MGCGGSKENTQVPETLKVDENDTNTESQMPTEALEAIVVAAPEDDVGNVLSIEPPPQFFRTSVALVPGKNEPEYLPKMKSDNSKAGLSVSSPPKTGSNFSDVSNAKLVNSLSRIASDNFKSFASSKASNVSTCKISTTSTAGPNKSPQSKVGSNFTSKVTSSTISAISNPAVSKVGGGFTGPSIGSKTGFNVIRNPCSSKIGPTKSSCTKTVSSQVKNSLNSKVSSSVAGSSGARALIAIGSKATFSLVSSKAGGGSKMARSSVGSIARASKKNNSTLNISKTSSSTRVNMINSKSTLANTLKVVGSKTGKSTISKK